MLASMPEKYFKQIIQNHLYRVNSITKTYLPSTCKKLEQIVQIKFRSEQKI